MSQKGVVVRYLIAFGVKLETDLWQKKICLQTKSGWMLLLFASNCPGSLITRFSQLHAWYGSIKVAKKLNEQNGNHPIPS